LIFFNYNFFYICCYILYCQIIDSCCYYQLPYFSEYKAHLFI
jgi:hypothetical protein